MLFKMSGIGVYCHQWSRDGEILSLSLKSNIDILGDRETGSGLSFLFAEFT